MPHKATAITPCHIETHRGLLQLIDYDEHTGVFTVLDTSRVQLNVKRDKLLIDGLGYALERLAWFYVTKKYPTAAIRCVVKTNNLPHDAMDSELREVDKSSPLRTRYTYSNLRKVGWEPDKADKNQVRKQVFKQVVAEITKQVEDSEQALEKLRCQKHKLTAQYAAANQALGEDIKEQRNTTLRYTRKLEAIKKRGVDGVKVTEAQLKEAVKQKRLKEAGQTPEQIEARKQERIRLDTQRGNRPPMEDRAAAFIKKLQEAGQ